MTAPVTVLLDGADEYLAGRSRVPREHHVRVAAWLVRAALESLVQTWLAAAGIEASRSTARAALACLRSLDPVRGAAAVAAWVSLSRCCHHHAYEIDPSAAEVRELLGRVRRAAGLPQTLTAGPGHLA